MQEKALTLRKPQVSLKISHSFYSVISCISDLFFFPKLKNIRIRISRFFLLCLVLVWLNSLCMFAMKGGEMKKFDFLRFPKVCGAHGCESPPTYFNSTICFNDCFC